MKPLKERMEDAKLRAKKSRQGNSAEDEEQEKVIDHVSRPNAPAPKNGEER